MATLPAPSTPLPRGKPLPVSRPATKWEQFATQKGITKKKRSKLVFDEGEQDWKRRFGYKKAYDDEAVPIIEARKNEAVRYLSPAACWTRSTCRTFLTTAL